MLRTNHVVKELGVLISTSVPPDPFKFSLRMTSSSAIVELQFFLLMIALDDMILLNDSSLDDPKSHFCIHHRRSTAIR